MACIKSPNMRHCWHPIDLKDIFYKINTIKKINEICCWCGKKKSFKIMPEKKNHGKYKPKRLIE